MKNKCNVFNELCVRYDKCDAFDRKELLVGKFYIQLQNQNSLYSLREDIRTIAHGGKAGVPHRGIWNIPFSRKTILIAALRQIALPWQCDTGSYLHGFINIK